MRASALNVAQKRAGEQNVALRRALAYARRRMPHMSGPELQQLPSINLEPSVLACRAALAQRVMSPVTCSVSPAA